MKIIAFDPGKSASWARYDTAHPHLLEVGDVDVSGVGRLARPCGVHITELIRDADIVLVEEVGTRPNEGSSSAFTFGMAFGAILAVVQSAGKPLRTVTPKQWSAQMRLKTGASDPDKKSAALSLVKELWPSAREHLTLQKHHNRADAALMVRWFTEYGPGKDAAESA